MCIAGPGQIIAINKENAQVSIMGIEEEVNIIFLEDVKIGEWVLIHTGYAISKIEGKKAREVQEFLKMIGKQ